MRAGPWLPGPPLLLCYPWSRYWSQQRSPCQSPLVCLVTSHLRVFAHSVPSACTPFYLLLTRPQPIYPSGFLLNCHFLLTTRCFTGTCAFPLVALPTFVLSQSFSLLLLGHLVCCSKRPVCLPSHAHKVWEGRNWIIVLFSSPGSSSPRNSMKLWWMKNELCVNGGGLIWVLKHDWG